MLKKKDKSSSAAPSDKKNWYSDRYQFVLVQRNFLILITLLSLATSLALTLIVNAKVDEISVEPFVIQMDQRSGITQVVDPVSPEEYSADEAVKKYFIVTYIQARESIGADMIRNYNIVRLMSDLGDVYNSYMWFRDPSNTDSPFVKLGDKGKRNVKIKSIIFIKPETAQVEVMLSEGQYGQKTLTDSFKIVYIEFRFAKLNMTMEERFINPLGFRVTKYEINEVSIPQ